MPVIPLFTTRVTVRRPDPDADPYEGRTSTVVRTGVLAHIGDPSGRERAIGGQQSEITDVLLAEPGELLHTDEIVDEITGDEYRISWVRHRQGLTLDHVKAGLVQFAGASVG